MMENEKIKVLVVEPHKYPYSKEIDSGLASLQHEVGGDIEAVYIILRMTIKVCLIIILGTLIFLLWENGRKER